ncbi:MAG: ABC transporter substrate-binding protein [Acidimicrobiia bacterium]|nr:ABC transporter substrate-binding protein [Acidimicrobiia bacterium]
MTLRDGVEFHDGSLLDAETSNTRSALLNAGVTGMEVVDDMTVKYVLSATNAGFPDLLRGVIGMPVSREAYEEMGADEFASNPVGTGPFMFDQWIRDGNLTVVRNPNYWFTNAAGEQLPYLDSIDFRPIPDEESRAVSLEADDIQVIQTLRGSTAKQVLSLVDDSDRDYRAVTYVGNLSGSAIFNTAVPPTDDVRVRRAFAMGSDGAQVAQVLGDDGLVPPSPGFFSADSPWFSQEAADAYPGTAGRDVEGARALLQEYMDDPTRSDGKPVGSPVKHRVLLPPRCQPPRGGPAPAEPAHRGGLRGHPRAGRPGHPHRQRDRQRRPGPALQRRLLGELLAFAGADG